MSSKYSRRTGELKPSELRRIKERDAYREFCKNHGWPTPLETRNAVFRGKKCNIPLQAVEFDEYED